jgi:hypothetical protein
VSSGVTTPSVSSAGRRVRESCALHNVQKTLSAFPASISAPPLPPFPPALMLQIPLPPSLRWRAFAFSKRSLFFFFFFLLLLLLLPRALAPITMIIMPL